MMQMWGLSVDAASFLLPSTLVLIGSIAIVGVGLRAVGLSPRDRASDRHFVLGASLIGSLALFVAGLVYRNVVWVTPYGDPLIDAALTSAPEWARAAFLWVWVVIASAVAGRFVLGLVVVQAIAWRGEEVGRGSKVASIARSASYELGVSRRVRIVCSSACASPFTFGVLRPTIVLPELAEYWPERQTRTVLLHEFAHIRRHDALMQLCAQLTLAACWWNPLCWVATRRVADLRESACDELVLARFVPISWYARLLVRMRRPRFGAAGLAFGTVHMAARGSLMRRVRLLRRRVVRSMSHTTPVMGRNDVLAACAAWVLGVMVLEGWLASLDAVVVPLMRGG